MTPVEGTSYRLYGIVQGVGFRPFVSRLARRLGVTGDVSNRGSFVEVHAFADPSVLAQFRQSLEREAPPRSAILKIDSMPLDASSGVPSSFEIIGSTCERGDIFVSPDIATCPRCRQELYDRRDRRYRHAFINCTGCGPRVTILDAMPYDRERTSMADFPMCAQCSREYHTPSSRRYDAQPVCCNDCGPQLYLLGREDVRGQAALRAAREKLIAGGIVAIKGIGGFHLACDAGNDDAVKRLRALKRRPVKPFAVMMRDLAVVRRQCVLPPELEEVLDGHQKPVILLERRDGCQLSAAVAPDNPAIGVMLPYAPVQMLLFRNDDDLDAAMPSALVMTSGNASGAPICRSDADAQAEISGFCDLMLSHDRQIRLRADDSVMDHFAGRPYMIRRSRGYAPLPFMVSGSFSGAVLGIGAELKNTFCPGRDGLFYPSPYIGDMADLRSVDALRESVRRLCALLEIRPERVGCDLHPAYNTTVVAAELGLPLVRIQHHWAHVVSCMAENGCGDSEVLGVAFDGTGYGTDHSIWGGEILRASYCGFERLASLEPFMQPGGDASSRQGWRIAAAMLCGPQCDEDAARRTAAQFGLCTPSELGVLRVMCARKVNAVVSTSAGRLFDAAAAVLGICRQSTFEGEAAMKLQFAAQRAADGFSAVLPILPVQLSDSGMVRLPSSTLIAQLAAGRSRGIAAEALAMHFHLSLAQNAARAVEILRDRTGLRTVALSGGVFQNTLLLGMLCDRLRSSGFRVLVHSQIPPNDGGICLGQAVIAAQSFN